MAFPTGVIAPAGAPTSEGVGALLLAQSISRSRNATTASCRQGTDEIVRASTAALHNEADAKTTEDTKRLVHLLNADTNRADDGICRNSP